MVERERGKNSVALDSSSRSCLPAFCENGYAESVQNI